MIFNLFMFKKKVHVFFVIFFLSYLILLLLFWSSRVFLSNIFSILGLLATISLFYHHYLKSHKLEKQFWLLHMIATGFFFLGEVISFYYQSIQHVIIAFPNYLDVLYLMLPIFFTIAYINTLYQSRKFYETLLIILDMLIMDVVFMVIIWQSTILPLFLQIDQSTFSIVMSISYTMIDILLALFVLTTLLFFRHHFAYLDFRFVIVGILIYLSSDIAFLIFNSTNINKADILNPLWTLAFIVIGMSRKALINAKPEDSQIDRFISKYRLIPPYLSFVILIILAINQLQTMDSLILGVVAASSFMIIRHSLTLSENQRLLNQLQQTNQGLEQVVNRRTGELRHALDQIKSLAYFDPLTGLPNRRKLQEYLSNAIDKARANQTAIGIYFLDLDRFKVINDTLGHQMGDKLLEVIAKRLSQVPDISIASRLGGDEYVVLVEGKSFNSMIAIAQHILKSVSNPIVIDQNELYITTSIGISLFPNDGHSEEQLIKHADVAMYAVKSKGKNNFHFSSEELNSANNKKLSLEKALHKALKYEEFDIVYQPQIDVNVGRIVGVEALLRWQHPSAGVIQPTDFIPIANETGLIVPIGEWIIKKVCLQAKKWRDTSMPIKVAINISPRQMLYKHFVNTVKDILADSGLEPFYLEFEITENISLHDSEMMKETLQELLDLGIKVAIDDFGTGYSSLSYLNNFPVSTIKIDRSFIIDIHKSNEHFSIVKLIIAMAYSLEKNVIAEGIEVYEQVDILRRLNCTIMQGYYFSKPISVQEFEKLLKKNYILTD